MPGDKVNHAEGIAWLNETFVQIVRQIGVVTDVFMKKENHLFHFRLSPRGEWGYSVKYFKSSTDEEGIGKKTTYADTYHRFDHNLEQFVGVSLICSILANAPARNRSEWVMSSFSFFFLAYQ